MVQSNKQLVHMLQAQGVLKTPRIIEALLHVDRADFCPITMTAYGYHQYHQNPYSDTPSSIGCNATISAPHMHAHALELLEPLLRPGKKVLDIGSGSGYLTVAMGYLVGQTGKVIGMEHIQDLVSYISHLVQANSSMTRKIRHLGRRIDSKYSKISQRLALIWNNRVHLWRWKVRVPTIRAL